MQTWNRFRDFLLLPWFKEQSVWRSREFPSVADWQQRDAHQTTDATGKAKCGFNVTNTVIVIFRNSIQISYFCEKMQLGWLTGLPVSAVWACMDILWALKVLNHEVMAAVVTWGGSAAWLLWRRNPPRWDSWPAADRQTVSSLNSSSVLHAEPKDFTWTVLTWTTLTWTVLSGLVLWSIRTCSHTGPTGSNLFS